MEFGAAIRVPLCSRRSTSPTFQRVSGIQTSHPTILEASSTIFPGHPGHPVIPVSVGGLGGKIKHLENPGLDHISNV